ncbi:MAG: bifunctional ornithine acetyltransferase/N-acetylglutamate synthase, partial [Cyanobacteria bacterium P01_F01_bin.42]
MAPWRTIEGGVTAPRGFQAAGIAAGLKASGSPDLALIVSDVPAIAAGVYTTSQVRAACVDYCSQRLQEKAAAQAILCNSGQANAGTGKQGWTVVQATADWLGEALDMDPNLVLAASTGVIGQQIPLKPLRAGIPKLIA